MSNSSIWSIERALSGATIPGQSGPGSDDNEGVLHIPQSSRTGALPSDCLVFYPGHMLEGCLTPLQKCDRGTLSSQPTGAGPFRYKRITKFHPRRPDQEFIDKKIRTCHQGDFDVLAEHCRKIKIKTEKRELKKLLNMRVIVVGATGSVPRRPEKRLKELVLRGRIKNI